MDTVIQQYSLQSSDGVHTLSARLALPEGQPKAIFQICHGMCEYFENYRPLIDAMTKRGYLVAGYDHLGHGDTAKPEEFGFFGTENGADFLVSDVGVCSEDLRRRFPRLPLILFGHSMGSFIVRAFMSVSPATADGIILSGTCGSNPALPFAKLLAKRAIRRGAGRQPNLLLNRLAFGGYNKRFSEHASAFDWLSSDPSVGLAYEKDPRRNFVFTAYGFSELFTLISRITDRSWARSVSLTVPVLLLAGRQDPVGNYGKGVLQTARRLDRAGVRDVSLIFYENSRHEPHNDREQEQELADLDLWISGRFAAARLQQVQKNAKEKGAVLYD